MTSPSFDDRYRLFKCVALGGGVRTHNAQETATGRPVMVHIVDSPDDATVERLRAQVGALPAADRSRVLGMEMVSDGFAIVTEFLAGLTALTDWLDARAAIPEGGFGPKQTESFAVGRVASSAPDAPAASPPPGEFTRLFQGAGAAAPTASASASHPTTTPAATPAAPPVAAPPVAAPPVTAPVAAPVAAPIAPPVAPPPAAPLAPGEFTALFRPPASPTPTDVAGSPLVRPSAVPGQQLPAPPVFGATAPALDRPPQSPFGPPPDPLRAPSLSAAFSAPPAAPDPFALGTPPAPPPLAPAPSALPPLAPSPLTAPGQGQAPLPPVIAPPVFGAPGATPGGPAVPASPLGAGGGSGSAGPSDYTMLIRQSTTPAPPVVKPAAPSAKVLPPARKRSVPLGLIIALNVVLVLAIALVLYFVLRPAPPNAVPAPGTPPAAPKVPAAPTVPTVPTVPSKGR